MVRIGRWFPFALAVLCATEASGQERAAIAGWIGGAGGSPTAGHALAGGSVDVRVGGRFELIVDGAYVTETPAGCAQWWPGSYRCSFHGTLATAGIGVQVAHWHSLSVAAVVAGGLFRHSDNTFKTTEPTASLGGNASLRLMGPVLLQLRYRFYEIFDENVEGLLGEKPSLHAVVLGIGIALWK